jgi:actin-related protein
MSSDLRKSSLNVSRSRPSLTTLQASDGTRSPHTPQSRSASGLYGSPGSSFRVDEDNLLVFDFGSRYLRAGFAAEPAPRCTIGYGPDLWRRPGDYRQWEMGYKVAKRKSAGWGEGHELWGLKVKDWDESGNPKDLDLGLVEDKIEKVVRECEHKYLMLDQRNKRVTLVVPSSLPRPLLNIVLKRLFEGLQAATVTLMPSAITTAVAAGVRSALVVDVGWFETTVTAICEYREVESRRSVRAGKLLDEQFRKLLDEELGKSGQDIEHEFSFEEVEDVMTRVGWCRAKDSPNANLGQKVTIPLANMDDYTTLEIPFSRLADPAEEVLFCTSDTNRDLDDFNLPLHQLIYTSLLRLPIDIRRICMSRILFTGGVSQLPGLKRRIHQELDVLVEERGWNPVKNYGSAKAPRVKKPLGERNGNIQPPIPTPEVDVAAVKHSEEPRSTSPTHMERSSSTSTDDTPHTFVPASLQPQEPDPIAEKLARASLSGSTPPPNPVDSSTSPPEASIRILSTLGSWAGASLLTNLRIRGLVEIDKERFLQHGFVGGAVVGKKESVEEPIRSSRQSMGPGVRGQGERGPWGMSVWG